MDTETTQFSGLAFDHTGNLILLDRANHTVRSRSADGTVATIGGIAGAEGHADGPSSEARFFGPSDVAVAPNGDLYIAEGTTIRRGVPVGRPIITWQPAGATVSAGGSVTFSVAAMADPAPTYQWSHNGTAIAGATSASLTVANVQAANTGTYTVTVTNPLGSVTSEPAMITLTAPVNPGPASTSSSGGGGAPSLAFLLALTLAAAARKYICR